MADVQTGIETLEQTGNADPQAPVAEVQAGAAAPEIDVAAREIDLNDERIRKEIEKARNDGFNAGKQNRDKELRIERGSDESIRTYHAGLVSEVERRLRAGEDLADIGKDTPLWAKANLESVASNFYQNVYEKAKEQDPDVVAALDGFATQDGLTAEHWQGLAAAAMNAVANGTKKTALTEWLDQESVEDIPSDSKRYKAIEAHFRKELEAELNAREIEGRKIPAVAPKTPTGNSTESLTRQTLESMSAEERLTRALSSDEERANMWELAMSN